MRLTWLLLALPFLALAQEYRGTILGRVTDSSGAVVVGASIRVFNVETGVSTGTTSNHQGNYQVPFLLPGDYRVEVEHPGFKKVTARASMFRSTPRSRSTSRSKWAPLPRL